MNHLCVGKLNQDKTNNKLAKGYVQLGIKFKLKWKQCSFNELMNVWSLMFGKGEVVTMSLCCIFGLQIKTDG